MGLSEQDIKEIQEFNEMVDKLVSFEDLQNQLWYEEAEKKAFKLARTIYNEETKRAYLDFAHQCFILSNIFKVQRLQEELSPVQKID